LRVVQCVQCARRDSRGERRHTFGHHLHRPVCADGAGNGQDVGSARLPDDLHPAPHREPIPGSPPRQGRGTGSHGRSGSDRRRLDPSSLQAKRPPFLRGITGAFCIVRLCGCPLNPESPSTAPRSPTPGLCRLRRPATPGTRGRRLRPWPGCRWRRRPASGLGGCAPGRGPT